MSSTWTSRRAWRFHVTLAILLPAFAWLFWWQLHRALGGNELSWAYTIEWPIFAVYAVFMWWKLLHEDLPATSERLRNRRLGGKDSSEREARELAAYNAYLASLNEQDNRPPPAASAN